MTLILCAYVGVVSWFASRIYYERQWGRDILRRVESLCAPRYGVGREAAASIHWDQDCMLSLRPLNMPLSGSPSPRTIRPATKPLCVKWRVGTVRFILAGSRRALS